MGAWGEKLAFIAGLPYGGMKKKTIIPFKPHYPTISGHLKSVIQGDVSLSISKASNFIYLTLKHSGVPTPITLSENIMRISKACNIHKYNILGYIRSSIDSGDLTVWISMKKPDNTQIL